MADPGGEGMNPTYCTRNNYEHILFKQFFSWNKGHLSRIAEHLVHLGVQFNLIQYSVYAYK